MITLPPTSYAGFFWHCGSFLVIDGLGESTCSYNTLSLLACNCGVFLYFLFINMYIITNVTIPVTMADTNTLTTHVIAIAVPSDEVLESK